MKETAAGAGQDIFLALVAGGDAIDDEVGSVGGAHDLFAAMVYPLNFIVSVLQMQKVRIFRVYRDRQGSIFISLAG